MDWLILLTVALTAIDAEPDAPKDAIIVEGDPCDDPETSGVINCDVADGVTVPYIIKGHDVQGLGDACGVRAKIIICDAAGAVVIDRVGIVGVGEAIHVIRSNATLSNLTLADRLTPVVSIQESTVRLERVDITVEGATAIAARQSTLEVEEILLQGHASRIMLGRDSRLDADRLVIHGVAEHLVEWSGDAVLRDVHLTMPARLGIDSAQRQNVSATLQSDWYHKTGYLEILGGHIEFDDTGVYIGDAGMVDVTGITFVGDAGSTAVRLETGSAACSARVQYNDIRRAEVRGNRECPLDARFNWWHRTSGPPTSPYATVKPWLHRSIEAMPRVAAIASTPAPDGFRLHVDIDGDVDRIEFMRAGVTWSRPAAAETVIDVRGQPLGLLFRLCIEQDCTAYAEAPAVIALGHAATAPHGSWWFILLIPITIGSVIVARHTNLSRIERRVRQALDVRAEEEEKARKDMEQWLAAAAHDLKGPTTTLVCLMEIVAQRAQAGEDVSAVLGMTQTTQRRVRQAVESIIGFARAGHEATAPAELDVRDTILTAVGSVDPGQRFVVDGPALSFVTDHGMLARIVQNLVLNAVEAGASGRVGFCLDGDLLVTVADDGPGLPAEVVADPANPFVLGSGMGIATAHRLARRLGGRVTLSYSGAGGTAWLVQIPSAA